MTKSTDMEFVEDGSETSSSPFDVENVSAKPEKEVVIAHKETTAILRIRVIVFLVLVFSAIGVGVSVFLYTTRTEERAFEQRYNDDSHKLFEAIGGSIERMLSSYETLAISMAKVARATNQTWPFVTIPGFAMELSKVLPVSDAIQFSWLPLITPERRSEWEAYTVQNDGWVDDAIAVQKKWKGYYARSNKTFSAWETVEAIVDNDGVIPYDVDRWFLPVWQNFPLNPVSITPIDCSWHRTITVNFPLTRF